MPEPNAEGSMTWRMGLRWGPYDDPDLHDKPFWPLSDGEVHHFYWFMQGSIINMDTRRALHRGWGLCERHAWAALAVEMCFRHRYLLGPAILYEDLLDRCLAAIPTSGLYKARRFMRCLRPKGPCIMCDMRIYYAGSGASRPSLIEYGRRTDALRQFAREHQVYWQGAVCGKCRGHDSEILCRPHLIKRTNPITVVAFEHLCRVLETTQDRVRALGHSYEWGNRGTDRPPERAALLTAIGWMSGWRPLLALTNGATAARSHGIVNTTG
jgi:hypothetical protein